MATRPCEPNHDLQGIPQASSGKLHRGRVKAAAAITLAAVAFVLASGCARAPHPVGNPGSDPSQIVQA